MRTTTNQNQGTIKAFMRGVFWTILVTSLTVNLVTYREDIASGFQKRPMSVAEVSLEQRAELHLARSGQPVPLTTGDIQ